MRRRRRKLTQGYESMTRILIAAIAALSVGIGTADAATKKKKARHVAPASTISAPANMRTPGPPCAGPNDCYTDEGYGRYLRCGGGMDM
jgi:hypothetical protein